NRVDREAEPRRVEPAHHDESERSHREQQVVEEFRAALDRARINRRRHSRGGADVLPCRGDIRGDDRQAERRDREVMAANAEDGGPEDERGSAGRQGAEYDAGEQRLVIRQARVSLHDRADIHPDAEEEHVAERVIAHLPAVDVPGDGEQDHQPQERELRRDRGCDPRRGERRYADGDHHHCTSRAPGHFKYRRLRATRMTISSRKMNAVWYSLPRTKPAASSTTPSPVPARMTPGRLPSPATITIMNERNVYVSPRYGWMNQVIATRPPAAP